MSKHHSSAHGGSLGQPSPRNVVIGPGGAIDPDPSEAAGSPRKPQGEQRASARKRASRAAQGATSGPCGASESVGSVQAGEETRAEARGEAASILDKYKQVGQEPETLCLPEVRASLDEDQESDRIERYGEAKRLGLAIAEYALNNNESGLFGRRSWLPSHRPKAQRQFTCGSYLVFRKVMSGDLAGTLRLHAADFCQQRKTCPFCALRSAARVLKAYLPKLLHVRKETGCRFYMLTATIPNGPVVRERVDHLLKSWSSFQKRIRHAQAGHGDRRLAEILGSLAHLEIKRGSGSGEWHPHIHAVICVRDWIEYEAVVDAWRAVSGGIAHLDLFHSEGIYHGSEEAAKDALVKDMCEVVKYPCKFNSMTAADVWHVALETERVRFLRASGCLYGVKLPEDLTDEALDWETLEFVERLYRFGCERGEYQLEREVMHGASPAKNGGSDAD